MNIQLMRLRKDAGYSNRDDFAKDHELNIYTYRAWESGSTVLNVKQLWDLAVMLNSSPNEILGWDEKTKSFADPRQQKLNECYENMNDSGQQTLVSVAQGLEKDPANRIIKDSPEHLETKKGA